MGNATDEKDIGALDDFPEGQPVLRKSDDGQRFACIRTGDTLRVLADHCPHQGYPLSQGSHHGGTLTCAWHNWKFDVRTGRCLTGGDAVRAYPVRVEEGRVWVDARLDEAAERATARAGLREGLFDDDAPRAMRDALRLAALSKGSLDEPFEVLIDDAARRGRWGFGHELAMLADLLTWVDAGDVGASEAFLLAALGVAERSAREPARPSPPMAVDSERARGLTDALEAEDLARAERTVRDAVRNEGPRAAARALVPFASRYIVGYGHGAIYLAKGLQLAERFPSVAEEVLAATTVSLATGTRETALPVWSATRRALGALEEMSVDRLKGALLDRPAFEEVVLEGEAAATQAVLARLDDGVEPQVLLRATAHAAAVRLGRFNAAWTRRLDAEADILDVSHAVTFAEAALRLLSEATPSDAARLAVLAAAFVGKLRAADGSVPPDETPASDLTAAVRARTEGPARARVRRMSRLDRLDAYRALRPFAALEAFVRPILIAHAVKTNEALRVLEMADPEADSAYLEAYVHLVAPRWPERSVSRIAAVAKKFMADGRPPAGVY